MVYFLSLQPSALSAQAASASQTQASPTQSASPTPATTPPAGQPQNSANHAPAHRRRKKTIHPDCSPTLATVNTGSESKTAKPGDNDAVASKPCPPPKVVVKNGGSDEPSVQLKGDTTAEKASSERSATEQLALGTEENLKKLAEHQLNPAQQEMVNQIKLFMDQSKAAVAAGDLERGRNLAVKAHLLSDELVKP